MFQIAVWFNKQMKNLQKLIHCIIEKRWDTSVTGILQHRMEKRPSLDSHYLLIRTGGNKVATL